MADEIVKRLTPEMAQELDVKYKGETTLRSLIVTAAGNVRGLGHLAKENLSPPVPAGLARRVVHELSSEGKEGQSQSQSTLTLTLDCL